MLLLISACTVNTPMPAVIASPTFTFQSTHRHTITPDILSTPTAHPTERKSNTPTSTVIPTKLPEITAHQIVELEYDPENIYKGLWTASWSADGSTILYAISYDHPREEHLEWFAYDLQSGSTEPLATPPISQYGNISPSGRFQLKELVVEPASTDDIESESFDIVLLDTITQEKATLLENVPGGLGGNPEWSSDETKVVISLAWYGTSPIYIVETLNGKTIPLAEIVLASIIGGSSSHGGKLSPDGSILACVCDPDATLSLVFLDENKVESIPDKSLDFSWSPDSKRLYYWVNHPLDNGTTDKQLRVYNTITKTSSTILQEKTLKSHGITPLSGQYSIAPNGIEIIFWWSDYTHYLWLVTLP
jgi:Tol biopolymer transport system component